MGIVILKNNNINTTENQINLPWLFCVIRCVLARRFSGGQRRAAPCRPIIGGFFHDAGVFKGSSCWREIKSRATESWCSQWADWRHMKCPRAFSVAFYARLPVERRNWMDNPKPEFLWVLTADKTPLLHKHSPSCSNRFANLILKHFLWHPPPSTIVLQTSWRGHRP